MSRNLLVSERNSFRKLLSAELEFLALPKSQLSGLLRAELGEACMLSVRGVRPEFWDVRPGKRDALAVSQRIGVVRCPLARRKGNAVTYTLVKTRRSQKQRLQHNSASRAPLSPHEWDARLLVAARVITQHPSVRRPVPMLDNRGKCVRHPSLHRASTHYSSPSSAAARQIGMEKGQNFTDGKDLHMVGAYSFLMVQTPAN